MGLESGSYISDLVSSNPAGTDFESQGDDHLRLIKSILQGTFTNASRAFRFFDSKAVQVSTYSISESADMHKMILFDCTSASLTANLPDTAIDGWWCIIGKQDSSANTVSIDPAGLIHINGGSTSITLTKQYQTALVWWNNAAFEWILMQSFPVTPYYAGAQDIPFSDIAPSANAKRILGAATATDFSEQTIATVLEWIGTCARGDIILRGASAFDRKALGSSGTFLKSDGTDLVYGGVISANLPAGTIVQRAFTSYTTNADITTVIPSDDTIPQVGEGTEILSTTITPRDASSRIRVRFQGFGGSTASGPGINAALFKDGGANAIAAVQNLGNGSNTATMGVALEFEHAPATTSLITYSIRVGPTSAGTIRMNGGGASRLFGGVALSTLVVEEIAG